MIKQEVQILLTMEVDADKSKEDIRRFFLDMEHVYTSVCSSRNRWEYSSLEVTEIKEEAEIFGNDESVNSIPKFSKEMIQDKINSLRISKSQKKERTKEGLEEVFGWELCLNEIENWINK